MHGTQPVDLDRTERHAGGGEPLLDRSRLAGDVDGGVGDRGRAVVGVDAQVHLRSVVPLEPPSASHQAGGVRLDPVIAQDVDEEALLGVDHLRQDAEVHVMKSRHVPDAATVGLAAEVVTVELSGCARPNLDGVQLLPYVAITVASIRGGVDGKMKRNTVKTGKFGIGTQIHTVHVGPSADELTHFYGDVFGGRVFMGVGEPTYSPEEDRYATLSAISDFCVEVMAPKEPVNAQMPVGKFFTKFGAHLHSVGYAVDDLVGLATELISHGVRIAKPGGGYLEEVNESTSYIFPNPRDTGGLLIELCAFEMHDDPRLLDSWSDEVQRWEHEHPLGIKRLAYQTLGVKDLDVATARFDELFAPVVVAEGDSTAEGARFRVLHLGDGLLRLAQPTQPGTPLADHVDRLGDMIYSVTFRVHDLAAVEKWLAAKSIRTTRLDDGLLAAEPADTYLAPYFFTTEDVPDDPFA